ncbi:MAG TPA: sialidase family protein [Pyrinomonadaceae bacterium]|nr:sialidase family protein [Pyrinomonadaceae bacterium]
MTSTRDSNQTRRLVTVLFMGLLLLSSCKRSSTYITATKGEFFPGLSQPILVSSGSADAAEPTIAASPDGSVYVAWVNHGPNKEANVMISRFNRDGEIQGTAARVNLPPGTATAWRGDPPTVAVAPDKTVYVGWTARVDSKAGHATNLYLSSSHDQGQTFAAPVKVNDDTKPGDHGMHSLAVGSDGRIYMAWLDERSIAPVPMKEMKMDSSAKGHMESNRGLYYATSMDGGHTFSANQRVASDVCPCCKTALAVSSDGHLYLSWRQVLPGDLRHIAVASSSDQGKTFTAPKIVSDDQWVLAGCPVSGPSLSVDKNGVLSVLWYSAGTNGQTGLYWSQSNDHGSTFDARKLVSAGPTTGSPVVVTENGVMAGVWEGNEGGESKVLTSSLENRETTSNSFQVADHGEVPAAVLTEGHLFIAYIAKDSERQNIWLVYAK